MKSMAEKKLRKIGMKRMKQRVIRQCLGNGEGKNLCRGDREPQRFLKFDFLFLTGIYGDWFVHDDNDQVDSDVNESSGLAADEDNAIIEDFADKVLVMAQVLARTTTEYTAMQNLEHVSTATTSEVSRLRSNKMSAWNLAMREEKESVSADLRRAKAGCGYKGRLGFTEEYAKEVANVYEEKREYYEEKVKEMNEEGRVCTMESLKRVQTKGVKLLRETASLLILTFEDIQYWPSRWHTSGTTAYIQSCFL